MKYAIACILTLLCSNNIYSQVANLFNLPENEQIVQIHQLYLANYDDTLELKNITDSIKTIAIKKDAERVSWYVDLFLTEGLDGQRKSGSNTLAFLLEKELYFTSSPFADVVATYHFIVGFRFFYLNNFERSFHYIIIASDEMEKIGYGQLPLIFFMAANITSFYASFEDYPTAIKFSNIAQQYPLKQPNPAFKDISSLNGIGYYYLKMYNYKKAGEIFKEVIYQAKIQHNALYEGIGSGNYGNTLRLTKRYEEALPYFYTDLALSAKAAPENAATTSLYIANSLVHLNQLDKAAVYIEKANALSALSIQPYQRNYYPTYYETKALLYKKQGQYKQASIYQDSLLYLTDSIRKLYDTRLLMATSLKENDARYLLNTRLKEVEVKNNIKTRNIILIALFVVFIIMLYAFWLKVGKEKLLRIQEKQKADELLLIANQQLALFVSQLQDKNNIIQKINEQLSVKSTPKLTPVDTKEDILHSSLITEADWDNFKTLFEQVHPGYIKSLVGDHPHLTPSETRLLVLLKLSMSTKDMAAMLGISVASLRTARYRLRKKYPGLLLHEELES